MKKVIYTFTLLLFALTSCNSGPKEGDNFSVVCSTGNIVTPDDGSEPYAFTGKYTFKFNYQVGTLEVSAENLPVNNNLASFSTQPEQYNYGAYREGALYSFPVNSDGLVSASGNVKISGMKGQLTSIYYASEDFRIAAGNNADAPLGFLPVMSYKIDGIGTVQTFPTQAFYSGRTTTDYTKSDGTPGSFLNEEPLYQFTIDLIKKKAILYMINAKFAEEMPIKLNLVLEDLDVKIMNGGYIIEGVDIVPQAYGSDGSLRPFPNYVFRSISFSTITPDLVSIIGEYTCGLNGQYRGKFTGAYKP